MKAAVIPAVVYCVCSLAVAQTNDVKSAEGQPPERLSFAERVQMRRDAMTGETEMKYAEGLRKLGLDELANIVLARIPEENNKAVSLARFQVFMHQNVKAPENIEKYIQQHAANDPELYWMMKIRLADAYWSWGKNKECFAIYEEFMKVYQEWTERAAKK